MDSTTLLGLVGIGGTLLGTVVGAMGTLGAARITSRTQATTEEQKARRQAYSACATACLARRDAAFALVDLFHGDAFDGDLVHERVRELDGQRDAVARAVGVVMVEDPNGLAASASYAAQAIEVLYGRLRDWDLELRTGRGRMELLNSQHRYALQDKSEVDQAIERFTEVCRVVLRPLEHGRPLFRTRWTSRFSRTRRIR
ncbi:hypothetical protein ACIP5U_34055 [Streptomyces sp. NPDC088788]|uniref:hypothetical protein n=1 Tax=Streptomyces sp. NPDC088788 TaxID=3365898 RepID=UPI00380CF28C